MRMVCTLFLSFMSEWSLTGLDTENNRYDKMIKSSLTANGQDIPDGGSSSGSGSGSDGGGGSGTGTNSSTPNGNGAGTSTDGSIGADCLHVPTEAQARLSLFSGGGELVSR